MKRRRRLFARRYMKVFSKCKQSRVTRFTTKSEIPTTTEVRFTIGAVKTVHTSQRIPQGSVSKTVPEAPLNLQDCKHERLKNPCETMTLAINGNSRKTR